MKVEIDDQNLNEGETRGFIHSKNYYFPKYCHWYLIITNANNQIIAFKYVFFWLTNKKIDYK